MWGGRPGYHTAWEKQAERLLYFSLIQCHSDRKGEAYPAGLKGFFKSHASLPSQFGFTWALEMEP